MKSKIFHFISTIMLFVPDLWMQICCVINGLYAVVGIAAFCLMGIS